MMDDDASRALLAEVGESEAYPIDPAAEPTRCGDKWQYYNRRLGAPNVWEVDVDRTLVDEAERMFKGAGLREAHNGLRGARGVTIQSFQGGGASFAVVQPKGWRSDINWFSVDDEATMDKFASIFTRLSLESLFAPVVAHAHTLRMYSALFVVRSHCSSGSLHADWVEAVGTSALTLITPLYEHECAADANGGFQLLYAPDDASGELLPDAELRQYQYKRGKAIVFGAGFRHSTEPGRAASADEPHAFLCLTFGTDLQERWPAIAHKGLRDQSRLLTRPDGSIEHTGLGEQLPDNSLELIRRAMKMG